MDHVYLQISVILVVNYALILFIQLQIQKIIAQNAVF